MADGHAMVSMPMKANTRFEELLQALSHEFEVLEKLKEDIASENSRLKEFSRKSKGDGTFGPSPLATPRGFETETPRHAKAYSPQSSTNAPDMPSLKAPPKTQAPSKPVVKHLECDAPRSENMADGGTDLAPKPLPANTFHREKEVNAELLGYSLDSVVEKQEPPEEKLRKTTKSVATQSTHAENRAVQEKLTLVLETVPAFVILMNALTMAFQADNPDASIWEIFEAIFVCCYFLECVLKVYIMGKNTAKFADTWFPGTNEYFLGADYLWNWFDFICLVASLIDLTFTYIIKFALTDNKSYKLLKIVRVARLTRLVRVLRYRFFDELRAMVLGVISGVRVLFWAIILLFYCIFSLGVLMQSLFGEDEFEFQTVPHSMFTVFRCYTDGCTTVQGTPLSDRLFRNHGGLFMVGYILSFMFITVGVFNLIMAIFIDNVVSSSLARKLQYISDNTVMMEERIKRALTFLINTHQKNRSSEMEFNLENEEDAKISISRDDFNIWLADPEMLSMLEDVTIETSTRGDLFDVLDVDMGGELEIGELLDGLMRLRGPITKSDIVAVRLKVSYLTKIVEGLTEMVEDLWRKLLAPGEEKSKASMVKEAAIDQMRLSSKYLQQNPSEGSNGGSTDCLSETVIERMDPPKPKLQHGDSKKMERTGSQMFSSSQRISSNPFHVSKAQRWVTPQKRRSVF